LQALWGRSLEEAQAERYDRIVAVAQGAASVVSYDAIGNILYKAIVEKGGKEILKDL
jgi:hypothetical protein